MRTRLLLSMLAAAALLSAEPPAKPPRFDLRLRATPRVGKVPATFLFTAELRGVPDSEAFHCLTLEWSWETDSTSTHEADCPAFVPGETKVQRTFTERHTFASSGTRFIDLLVKKGDKVLGKARVQVHASDPKVEFRQTEIVRD
jgi:hypothetical protein